MHHALMHPTPCRYQLTTEIAYGDVLEPRPLPPYMQGSSSKGGFQHLHTDAGQRASLQRASILGDLGNIGGMQESGQQEGQSGQVSPLSPLAAV
jgi:hypothetical protein